MHIAALTMQNWVCYAGEQILDLKPVTYSVVAIRNGDRGRSNYSGKTTLLQAPRFALYGEHGASSEDAWITKGESEGGVELLLEDGNELIRVRRFRKRGKSTQLTVNGSDGQVLKGDEAQRFIDRRVGLTSDDFDATCYFAQRQMARMVLASPKDRMDIITGWLRMEPLVAAEEHQRKALTDLSYERESTRARMQGIDEAEARALQGKTVDDLTARRTEVQGGRVAASLAREEAFDALKESRRFAVARSKVEEYEKIVLEGKQLVEQLAGVNLLERRERLAELDAVMQVAAGLAAEAQKDLQLKRKVALGQFDGRCPVAGIHCPAEDDINQKGKRGRTALQGADAVAGAATQAHNDAIRDRQIALYSVQMAEKLEQKVEGLRDRIRGLTPEYRLALKSPRQDDSDALETRYQETCNRVSALEAEEKSLTDSIVRATVAKIDRDAMVRGVAELDRKIDVKRESLLVFGKLGAQKRVAEAALGEIQDGANEMLRECGIDLSVEVLWSREGEGLAKTCDGCGAPFSTSQRVKSCERCGAVRGPLLVNRLEIQLSDRSGAAEDLVGASLQLAASTWLREERAAAWSVALLDEPTSQMDASNRRAFMTHLAGMLSGRYGFRQAMVVSHHSEISTMLPGCIEIENRDGRATVRVVA